MDSLVYLLPVLGCAAMMGAMMWMMGRGRAGGQDSPGAGGQDSPGQADPREIEALRKEIAALREEAAGERQPDG